MRLLHFLVGQNLLQGPGQEHVLRLLPLIHGRGEGGGGGSSDPRLPAAGGEEEGTEEKRERRGGGGGREEAWRAAAGSGRGGRAGAAAVLARGVEVLAARREAARRGLRPSGLCSQPGVGWGGRFSAAPLTGLSDPRRGGCSARAAVCWGPRAEAWRRRWLRGPARAERLWLLWGLEIGRAHV